MISSGTKRGLAVTAVAALAATGLPLFVSTASAVTLNSSVSSPTDVIVTAPDTATASTKNDGQNTTIRLEAIAGNDVAQVRFEYSPGGGYTTIATVARNDDGAFSFEWPATGLDGDRVSLRAVGLNAAGTAVNTTAPEAVTVNKADKSVNITDGTAVGVFQKPDYDGAGPDVASQNVIVSGTASSPSSAPTLEFFDPSAHAYAPGGTASSTTATGATTGTWAGVMDITGYDYGAADELLVKATDVTDDAEAYALYKQAITTVQATADRTTVPSGTPANVTITVADQNSLPMAGVEVRNSNGVLIGQTNRNGKIVAQQNSGAVYYYANATASDPYEPNLGDKQSNTITVTEYTPAPTSLAAGSTDGMAFDFDEYAPGDITVQVKDQNGNNLDTTGQVLSYHWTVTPFAGGAAVRFPAAGEARQAVDNGGKFEVAFPVGGPEGTYVLTASLGADALGNGAIAASTVLTVKAGEAEVRFDEEQPEQAPAGTSEVVDGKIALDDGTGLPNRNLSLTYHPGAESGPGAGAGDAGIVQSDGSIGLSLSVKSNGAGSFTATIKDPVENPQPRERNGRLDVASAPTPSIGDAGAAGSQGVDFLLSLTPATINVISGANIGKPGVPEPVRFRVRNADGELLTNLAFTAAIDHGFFTDGTADPAPVVGGDAGEFTSLGSSVPLKTNGSGEASAMVTIERDAGFDDDGRVVSQITATAGAVSVTGNQVWDSSNPLNGGSVTISRAAAAFQTVGVLPKAPTNEGVAYDVRATDQFANLTDVPVVVTDDLAAGTVNGSQSAATVTSEFTTDAPRVYLESSAAGNQTPTATWTAGTTKYVAPLPTTSSAGTETLTDTGETVNWYVINFAQSRFTLSHDTANTVPVGQTVIETYKAVDQNGEPVRGQQVQFFRSGPDTLQDGSPATNTFTFQTGEDGKAVYVFSGAAAGTATIQALITDANGADGSDNNPIGVSRATDALTFSAKAPNPAPVQAVIDAVLRGSSKGNHDKITVNAESAADGAKATLYRRVKGKLVRVKVKVLNAAGDTRFNVRDTNGSEVTKYVVVVDQTADSKADKSKIRLK